MSDIELAIKQCKKLEAILAKVGGTGRGLHEKVTSVESRLPEPLVRKLRFIATVRNKIVHDENYEKLDDRAKFIDACDVAQRELRKIAGIKAGIPWRRWLIVGFVLAVIAVALWLKFRP